jgi:hypothetical protein
MRCKSITKLRGLGKLLYWVRFYWENEISNEGRRTEGDGVEI